MKVRKPSVSLGVSIVALAVAMSGTAVAATLITTAQIKDGTIRLTDINPAAIAKLKGEKGPKGATGTNGAPGANGAPGSARAFAYVSDDGTVDAARSKNISVQEDVAEPGIYCVNVENIDPATIAPIVTVSDTPLLDGAAGFWTAYVTLDPTILAGEQANGDCENVPDFLVIVKNGGNNTVSQDFTISVP